jgi:Tol biopolymer transport system component
MPHQHTTNPNNSTSTVVLFKEPAMHHHTPANHRLPKPKQLAGPGRVVLGLMLAWIAVILPTSPAHAATADPCLNGELRALNNSTGLPDCRAYEMVTPPYKEGFNLQKSTYGDGAVAYTSPGNFADNPYGVPFNQYVARRSETGWKTISMNPPGEQWAFASMEGAQSGMSNDLRSSLWPMRPRLRPEERGYEHGDRNGIYVRRPDGVFSPIAPNPGTTLPRVYATTGDLSHVVLGGDYAARTPNLYEVSGGDQVLRPIGVDNTGAPLPHADGDTDGLCSLGISDNGRVIFLGTGNNNGCLKPLRARVGGATTIDMSASQCTRGAGDPGGICNADAPVNLAGFARDGSRVFMTTTQQLVNGDTDATNDLYVCDIPAGAIAPTLPVNVCPNLRQLSAGADVEGRARISEDGSHVYFVAQGVLAANRGANDQTAAAGAHNLYLWQTDAEHPDGHITFLVRLLSDDVTGNSATQTTPDGRYLVVTTTTALVTSGPGADTDGSADVYRYDSQTDRWLRLSTDATGSGGNTEGSTLVWFYPAMTDDGDTVVFTADEPLAPADTNSGTDVYVWHEGQVSLISPDGGAHPGISSSGRDIYFTTTTRVTAADSDANIDVYDARVGGGFDLREPKPCEGEGCLAAPSAPPGLASGAGGLGGLGGVEELAPRFALRGISIAQQRTLGRTGRVTVTVTANSPGTVSARVTTTIGGKPSNGAMARERMVTAGSVQLALTLSRKARARLVSERRLSVRVVVSHSKVALVRSVSVRLSLAAKAKNATPVSHPKGGRS